MQQMLNIASFSASEKSEEEEEEEARTIQITLIAQIIAFKFRFSHTVTPSPLIRCCAGTSKHKVEKE